MHVRRRFLASVAAGCLLAGLSVVLSRPVLLIGVAGIGGWLLAHQLTFVREIRNLRETVNVDQVTAREHVMVDETVVVSNTVTLRHPMTIDISIESQPPVFATKTDATTRTVSLSPGETTGETTYTIECPVAGTYRFEPPQITVRDGRGLFEEMLSLGDEMSLTVEPRLPRRLHVGEGGNRIAAAYGDHDAGRSGSGLNPAELRKYVVGDNLNRIDWKATARLQEPHVREFEAETDLETVLVFDHRTSMETGLAGETKLAYLRQVALTFIHAARRMGDPLGFYGVGDEGVTVELRPQATADRYRTIRTLLTELEATPVPDENQTRISPAAAHRAATAVANDDSAFAETLHPYFDAADQYVARLEGDPLVSTIRTRVERLRASVRTIIFTDDSNPLEVREAVKLARRGDESVVVFLAPTVLFETGGLSDLDQAYERYLEFEELRRDLAGLDRVSAYEVGPGDRLDTILSARTRRQSS